MSRLNFGGLLQELCYAGLTPPQDQTLQTAPTSNPTSSLTDLLGESLAWEQTFPAQAAQLEAFTNLPLELQQALERQGFTGLYTHQLRVFKAVNVGKDVVLTVPTAAGKTLAAYLPILSGVMQHEYRCLSFYGLKALASDQAAKLTALLDGIPQSDRPRFVKLTGDTSKPQRQSLLATEPHILAITPDLLHFELKQVHWSEAWQQFLSQLRYVVIDELHSYSGVFGANMHWLLQRLKLAVDNCGGDSAKLQFICLSATVGNPKELTSRLTGRNALNQDGSKRLVWIYKSGAAQAAKRLIVTQPTTNTNAEAAKLVVHLMQQGFKGIIFCNAIKTTKAIVQLVEQECQRQGMNHLRGNVASFYGALTDERRQQITQQLEQGNLLGLVATSALEAGIDLPQLDYCIVLGFPGTVLSFLQRMGRAGRKNAGLAIYLPRQQSLLDLYFSEPAQLLSSPEPVHFNPHYPIMVASHLLCAAAESGIPAKSIKRYFGEGAATIAQKLLKQRHLQTRRDGTVYARGFPHAAISFRGGIGSTTYKLLDTRSGQTLETMTEDQAYRQVYPGAIYQVQTEQGQLQTYQVESLESGVAKLSLTDSHDLRTHAQVDLNTQVDQALVQPVTIDLNLGHTQTELLVAEPAHLKLSLNFGTIAQVVKGYQVEQYSYDRTCLNRQCLNFKVALPGTTQCPLCHKKTRDTEIVKVIDTIAFEQPYKVEFQTPILSVTLNDSAIAQIEASVKTMKLSLQNHPQFKQYQSLWDCPSHYVAIHSLGHQLMKALPLTVLHSYNDLDFICYNEGGTTTGLWFDTCDGGNGATEAVLKYWDTLVPTAQELAQTCDCEAGCPRCLSDYRCPDQNKGLVKQVGLMVLAGVTPQTT